MKKVLTVVLAFLALQLSAQRHEGSKHHDGDMKKDGREKLTAAQKAELETKKMTLFLDLTAEQQTKVNAINLEVENKRKALHDERRAAHENAKVDNDTKPKPNKNRYEKMNERLDAQIAYKQKMKEVLTEAQYQKLDMLLARKGNKGDKSKRKRK